MLAHSSPETKLFKLKEWVTIPDAARYLSTILEDKVNEADVVQLGLENHLTLSVYFVNGVPAKPGRFVSPQDARVEKVTFHTGEMIELVGPRTPYGIFEIEDRIVSLKGVFDLPLIGGEKLDVLHAYSGLIGGAGVTGSVLEGAIVLAPGDVPHLLVETLGKDSVEEDKTADLSRDPATRKPVSFVPAGGLPAGSVLVVRTSALRTLGQPEPKPQKPLGSRERDSLLVVIAALMEMNLLDWKRPSKSADAIASQTERMGARIAARTIENYLNRIADAFERRATD